MKQYYGQQTEKALENFPFPLPTVHKELIHAIVEVKKATAIAHSKIGELDSEIAKLIVQACDEVLSGIYEEQFVTSALQGGAGTSIHMNVNEVIASRSTELASESNKSITVHPNDHVNKSQSTNDVNPTALKITCIRLTEQLIASAHTLKESFRNKSMQYANTPKLGRTHIQDAVPITVGSEFESYASIIERDIQRIEQAKTFMYDCNLGGTAVGNSINASPEYINQVYIQLEQITNLPIKKATNFMSQTSSGSDFYWLATSINALCADISKIATDIRFLSSGPKGGIKEIELEERQKGSSIMPGKINPVIPETMNQMYYLVSGKTLAIEHAVEGAHLELGIMFPTIADNIITILKTVNTGLTIFATHCIDTLIVNEARCKQLLEQSMAYATLLTPVLGYDKVSELVNKAVTEEKTLADVVLETKTLTKENFYKIVSQ